jgi:RNA polymerase sigma-70 factor (ECF subfamily)
MAAAGPPFLAALWTLSPARVETGPVQPTSVSLLERLRNGTSAEAWDRFVHLYTPMLHHWARRAGLQEADASDLVQEVLVLLIRKLPEFEYDRRQSFRAWLLTVTRNKWSEICRRRQLTAVGGKDLLGEVAAVDDVGDIEESEYRQQLVKRALEAMRNELPASTWSAFQEYVLSGHDVDTVAAQLGVRVGTVYAAKSRVLARLRQELAGLLD